MNNNTDLLHLANQQIQSIILNALSHLTKLQKLSTTRCHLCDIQYSFCLNKRNQQQLIQLHAIENFVDDFIENLLQTVLDQVCTSTLGDQSIDSYVDQFIGSTIRQAMSNIVPFEIDNYAMDLTENILDDAVSTIVDDELYTQWQLTNENTLIEQQTSKSIDTLVNNLAQDIYFRSFDNLRE